MRVDMTAVSLTMVVTALMGGGQPAREVTVESNVQYCTGNGQPLLMDVFIPARRTSRPTPAVLWIHGGGWAKGDKSANSGAQFLAEAGFLTASLSYRLTDVAPFPAQIEDCQCAVRFLRANASRYGIDPGRIGAAGSSAGGHLAELLGTSSDRAELQGTGSWAGVSSRVQAVASYFGVSDLTQPFPADTMPVIVKLLQGSPAEKPKLARQASPLLAVSKTDPPLFLVHGEEDRDVPFDQSVRMADAYHRLGLPVQFVAVKNAAHDFAHVGAGPITPSVEAIHQLTVDFFKRYLVGNGR